MMSRKDQKKIAGDNAKLQGNGKKFFDVRV